jgi:hypothetical protein
LEHLNKLVVEPIDDILIFSMFQDIHIGDLALMFENCENHLCVITKYEFWMLEVTFSHCSRAIVERCHREIKKNSPCILANHLELVMHVRSILEMVACFLHFNEKFLYAH